MKKLLLLLILIPFFTGCAHHKGYENPLWLNGQVAHEAKLHQCRVTNNHGKNWTRSAKSSKQACHRAFMACRTWYGDLHHKHHPAKCKRIHVR